ncbi:MAG TPA: hypothetical protein VFW98_17940 [Gemmatimonadaceae bacterium]|nr:hypothetical protein [Gemmatimonadaceae bacterium]
MSWSGGKDSMMALEEIRRTGMYEVVALLTTMTAWEGDDDERISVHGVRGELLRAQTAALGLPLLEIPLPRAPSNAEYEARMAAGVARAAERWPDARVVVHGDLFLEEIRRYREALLARCGLRALFPLWGRDTAALARDFVRQSYRAVLTCVDTRAIDRGCAGREFDDALLDALPPSADPCGENGEFHTFVYNGPCFTRAVAHRVGRVTMPDERFAYAELLAGDETSTTIHA